MSFKSQVTKRRKVINYELKTGNKKSRFPYALILREKIYHAKLAKPAKEKIN